MQKERSLQLFVLQEFGKREQDRTVEVGSDIPGSQTTPNDSTSLSACLVASKNPEQVVSQPAQIADQTGQSVDTADLNADTRW